MELRINNLAKTYGNKQVLNIEKLVVSKGTFLGLIGPNGAGKSTLVKIIAGIEKSSSGEVLYDDHILNEGIMKNITLIFQKPYLFRTSVFHNIAYPLMLRRIPKSEINLRVNRLLKEMEIEHIKEQKAWTLSGGEAQKVALARGLIFKPSVLILDEFTANIDPASMLVIERSLKGYYDMENPTVIMVTHNIQQAKRLCNQVAFLNHGAIEEIGDSPGLIHHPQHPNTQRFISGEIVL